MFDEFPQPDALLHQRQPQRRGTKGNHRAQAARYMARNRSRRLAYFRAYAAARDAACWQLNRSERDVFELLADFESVARCS